jgi:hypothetical protein
VLNALYAALLAVVALTISGYAARTVYALYQGDD